MKKFLLLCVLFPLFVHSQTTEQKTKFGVGVGYSLNTAIENSVHPVELLIQYRATQHHSFYLDLPIYISNKEGYDRKTEGTLSYDVINKLYGVGIGYTYSKLFCPNFYGFVGIGFEYMYTKDREESYEDDSYRENISIKYAYSRKRIDAYSLLPQLGLRYVLGPVEAEVKYKLYISRIKEAEYAYEKRIWKESTSSSYTLYPVLHKTSIQNAVSFSLSYFF